MMAFAFTPFIVVTAVLLVLFVIKVFSRDIAE